MTFSERVEATRAMIALGEVTIGDIGDKRAEAMAKTGYDYPFSDNNWQKFADLDWLLNVLTDVSYPLLGTRTQFTGPEIEINQIHEING